MARPKPTKKAPAPKAPTTPAPAAESAEQISFDRARNELPAPSALVVRALRRIAPADRCQQLGAATKAVEIAREARRTLLGAVDTVRTHGAALRYRPERLRFAMDLVHDLELSIELQSSTSDEKKSFTSKRTRAESEARAARKELVDALSPIITADEDAQAAFAAARSKYETPEDFVESISALAVIAKRWIASSDEELRALAALQSIDDALVSRAERAAASLRDALDEKSRAGIAKANDSVATNELEGRLVIELDALSSAVESNRSDSSIPLPRLGPATLRALRKGNTVSTSHEPPPAPEKP